MTKCPNCGNELQIEIARADSGVEKAGRRDPLVKLLWSGLALSILLLAVCVTLLVLNLRTPLQDVTDLNQEGSTIGLQFACVDAGTEATISDCTVHVQIVEEIRMTEFDVMPGDAVIHVPIMWRLSIMAASPGYSPVAEIFEYTETGEIQIHTIRLNAETP